MYDAIVVGGGHAGCEAALALARMNKNTLLITGNINNMASMPCNPSIGGPAKGIVVREIDALGGEMAKIADKTQIQMKMLNSSKGPAVRALRAQSDKLAYKKAMQEVILNQENLEVYEGFVDKLIVDNFIIKGVKVKEKSFYSSIVILTTGTYLNSKILRGHNFFMGGPDGENTSYGISEDLRNLGFKVIRLKTGTPPRVKTNTIDFSKLKKEPGDEKLYYFSFENEELDQGDNKNVPCYLTYTTKTTHELILNNLEKSAMYGGVVEGVGPRYCPSIEDKIVRFKDKERHQIFLEPESLSLNETYVQGFSTSMPEDIQEKMVHSLPGLENVEIIKFAYAIEYDAINPLDLKPSLETKIVSNLFCAGQINGTSGYEEAACQGLIAAINAKNKLENLEPLILKRDEAYIGVLIDDLITKGVLDPYRLLTSRAEYRLLLRNDNADERLIKYGKKCGLISEKRYSDYLDKQDKINNLLELFKNEKILPNEKNNSYLLAHDSAIIKDGISMYELLKRPEITYKEAKELLNLKDKDHYIEEAEIKIKYKGYIEKAEKEAKRLLKIDEINIPDDLDYDLIHNLASEAKDKLKRIKPKNLGMASRISGVNPSDISLIMVFLESRRKKI